MLVVDDGSPDGTADIAERIGKELGNVEVMRRHEKSGLGSAYRAGFRWGLEHGFDACVEMDADLSHEPEALPDLVAPLSEGYELVIGSRYVPGGSHSRLGLAPAASVAGRQRLRLDCCWAWGSPIRRLGSGPTRPPCSERIDLDRSGPTATASRSR